MGYERKTMDIHISPKLRKVLEYFENDSEYAKLLLKNRIHKSQLVDDPINYLSVSKDDCQRISYLNDKRKARIEELNEDIFESRYRYHCKPGAFLNKLFKDVSDKDIETFSSYFRTFSMDIEYTFKVVTGDSIRDHYNYRMHENNNGTLGVSCMKHDQCREWLKMYSDNDMVSMVVMMSNRDKVIGRALLWDLGDVKIMDRVYTIYDEQYAALITHWAKKNGYLFKEQQNWYNTIKFKNDKSEVEEKQLTVQLKYWNYEYYPYLDTFKWIDMRTGIMYNYRPAHFNNDDLSRFRILSSPHGGYDRPDHIKFDEVDRVYCYAGDITIVDGIQTNMRNCEYSEVYDRYLLRNDAVYREDINSYVYADDSKNDNDLIQKRLDYFEARNKERALRKQRDKELYEQRTRSFDPFMSYTVTFDDGLALVNSEETRDTEPVTEPTPPRNEAIDGLRVALTSSSREEATESADTPQVGSSFGIRYEGVASSLEAAEDESVSEEVVSEESNESDDSDSQPDSAFHRWTEGVALGDTYLTNFHRSYSSYNSEQLRRAIRRSRSRATRIDEQG